MESICNPIKQEETVSKEQFQSLSKEAILNIQKTATNTHIVESISPNKEHPDWPKVEVISSNGKVEKIIVSCECGKRFELQCDYS